MRTSQFLCGGLLLGLLGSSTAYAEDGAAQKALAKAQFLLRQATAEKSALQSEVDALKQQVDRQSRELDAVRSAAGADKQRLEQKYGTALDQWKTRDDKNNEQLGALRDQLKKEMAQRAELEESLKKSGENFALCYENNKKLYSLNSELLERYQHKGFADVLVQREPFTGLKQVDVENLIQDYQYQIDSLKIKSSGTDSINEPGGKVAAP